MTVHRNAPIQVLYQAVTDACICTHNNPVAIDAAFILAGGIRAPGWAFHLLHVRSCDL